MRSAAKPRKYSIRNLSALAGQHSAYFTTFGNGPLRLLRYRHGGATGSEWSNARSDKWHHPVPASTPIFDIVELQGAIRCGG